MEETTSFEVYSTATGLKQISNPIRQKILNELQRREMSLSEIAALTGKAQSTLSSHLDELTRGGLIASRGDPGDNRRKIFYLTSKPIGGSVVPREDLREVVGMTIAGSIGTPSTFLKGVIRSIIIGMQAVGLKMDPMLKDVGKMIGTEISKRMKSDNIEGLIKEIQVFYDEHDLGEVCVYSVKPLSLVIRDEYNCHKIPEAGRTFCLLNEGILGAIFESRTGMALKVKTSTECLADGFNHCRVYIEPAPKPT
ncbi:MAG: helix-turn-helix domain-containing protein [Methanomassiliicoccales archaeon]|jgi:predicted hydrocarbon binding protein